MGQSVHPTGFRLVKLKNWENRECLVEKERYSLKNNLIDDYITKYLTRTLHSYFKNCFSRRLERSRLWREYLMNLGERRVFHWSGKLRYKLPHIFYSHSVVCRRNGRLEVNVILYSNFNMREIYEKRQKVIKRDLEKKKRKQRSKKQKEFIKHLREKKSLTYRWFMEKKWKELLKNILEARIKHNFKEEAKIKINFLKSPWIKSSLFARYAVFILKRRKGKMGRIMENLLYRTKYYGGEKHNIYGIYITGAGRFTKRQRASFRKNQRGRTPFSTVSAPLEFSEMSVPLKYGACNVRVWVCHLQS